MRFEAGWQAWIAGPGTKSAADCTYKQYLLAYMLQSNSSIQRSQCFAKHATVAGNVIVHHITVLLYCADQYTVVGDTCIR